MITTLVACLLSSSTAFALPDALTPSGKANVELVANNLEKWVREMRAAKPKDNFDEYTEVVANIRKKLKDGSIKSVPGLTGGGRYYRGKDDPNKINNPATDKPSGAFCDDWTWVKEGNNPWVRCPEGDIIMDGDTIDPTPGTGIDETEQAGWERKWRLLHILVHEKWHERVVSAQVKELVEGPAYKHLTPEEQRRRMRQAKRDGLGDDHHGEVYKAGKRVVQGYRELLENELKNTPKTDVAKRTELTRKIAWLKAEHNRLENAMKHAAGEVASRFSGCGWPGMGAPATATGTVAVYVTQPNNDYWRMDVDVRRGEVLAVRLPVTLDWGVVYNEEPIPHAPRVILEMPTEVFTGMTVQPDSCAYLAEALEARRIKIKAGSRQLPGGESTR